VLALFKALSGVRETVQAGIKGFRIHTTGVITSPSGSSSAAEICVRSARSPVGRARNAVFEQSESDLEIVVSEPTDPVTVAPRVRHKGRRPGNVRPCGGVVQVLVAVLSWRSNSVSIAEWLIDDGYPASFLDHCQKGFSRAVMLFGSERVRVSVHVSEFVQAFHCSN
jgi:hypothetical protein